MRYVRIGCSIEVSEKVDFTIPNIKLFARVCTECSYFSFPSAQIPPASIVFQTVKLKQAENHFNHHTLQSSENSDK
jgi:hypothetical protein